MSRESFDHVVYWNKRLSGNFGLESVGYLGLGLAFNRWMYRVRKRIFTNCAKQLGNSSTSSVLDVGSGTGFYIDLWKSMGYTHITGVDISTQAVESLRSKHPGLTFVHGDVSDTSLQLPKARLISCMDVLFHVVDEAGFDRALSKLSHALEPGGTLILSDNFLHGPEKRLSHHVSRTLADYTAALERHGFRIVSRKPMFVLLNYPVDSDNRLLHFLWHLFNRFIPGREWLGNLAGAVLYPLELLLLFFVREGPTTELMICEKC
jgi:SAM-dependent methyltransferase